MVKLSSFFTFKRAVLISLARSAEVSRVCQCLQSLNSWTRDEPQTRRPGFAHSERSSASRSYLRMVDLHRFRSCHSSTGSVLGCGHLHDHYGIMSSRKFMT